MMKTKFIIKLKKFRLKRMKINILIVNSNNAQEISNNINKCKRIPNIINSAKWNKNK